jgi:hypothetical protein
MRSASAAPYYVWDDWGGTWHDADKTLSNAEDDLMCWAAAASNVLDWTGWGNVPGKNLNDQDDVFGYFQDHWTDNAGMMSYGWYWWFYGTNISQGWDGWSQVDVAGGGNFYPTESFFQYYHSESNDAKTLKAIDHFLHEGYGVTLGLYGPGGHALTVWGYEYDEIGYKGIYVTDSDDHKGSNNPPDVLVYYDVLFDSGAWYLQGFGSDNWYIGEVQALAQYPAKKPGKLGMPGQLPGDISAPVPEPATILLFGSGIIGCVATVKRKRFI